MSSTSSSSSDKEDSSSDSEVLHELCNKVNLGLANANTVDTEYESSLSAIKKTDASVNIELNKCVPGTSTAESAKHKSVDTSLKSTSRKQPVLKRNDSLEKVIKFFDSRSVPKCNPSTSLSNERLSNDKLVLNAETLLILNLLSMSSESREQYLIETAKQRKLLLTNSKTKTFNVNPELFAVNNVPQVVDFVHQYHGKPIPTDITKALASTSVATVSRKANKKSKASEKQQVKETKQKESFNWNFAPVSDVNSQQCQSRPSTERSSVSNVKLPNKQTVSQLFTKFKVSTQSGSLNQLTNIVDIPKAKPRTLSASDSVGRLFSHTDPVNTQRHDAAEAFSKRQQKRLRKQLKAMSLQSTMQANAEKNTTQANVEKNPRKRGRRGSKKEAEVQQQPQATTTKNVLATTSKLKTDTAAKNMIRLKCSQISVNIQEKLNLCSNSSSSVKLDSSERVDHQVNRSDDLVVESDMDNYESAATDSSNCPSDEETSMARSDEIESSCNEKQIGPTEKNNVSGRSVANEDVPMHREPSSIEPPPLVSPPSQSSSNKILTNPSGSLHITNEALLIMSLLTVPEQARNNLLETAAINANIFLKNQSKKMLNPRLVRIKGLFTSPKIVKFIDEMKSGQQEEKQGTYESEVNQLVRRFVPEVDSFKYVLKDLIYNGRYAFDDAANKKQIAAFVDDLTKANLGRVIEGDVRVNEYDNTEAYMTNEEDDRDVYFATLLLRQFAFHSSRVKAFVFTADDRTPYQSVKRIVRGFVVDILDDQLNKPIVGKFEMKVSPMSNYLIITPEDRRLPQIRIDKRTDPMLSSNAPKGGTLYLVKLSYWKNKNKAYGTIVEEIGKADELEAGNRVVLLKNCLKPLVFTDIDFSFPKEPFVIPETEYKLREDLTKCCIFTIDPVTARDLDDAVSCKKLENGNYEIGCHISDVSHFIEENSQLDNMIKEQATTIYLVNTVYHMLPRELCMLCSLLPGQNKLAFSVFWEMTPNGQLISTRFAKTIINSCVQLAYQHAQLMIDEPDREFKDNELPTIYNGFNYRDLSETVNALNSIAILLRKRRFDNGCISINQTKIIFDLNDDGDPISFRPDERKESNFLIEEFMLLANQSVAKFIYEKFPDVAILRNHGPPKANMMEELVAKLTTLNHKMDISSSKAIANSLSTIIKSSGNNAAVNAVINSMVAKPMVRAEYFCSGFIKSPKSLFHFALSIPIYTHFTSPIRRYPDILVHRLLAAALNLAPVPTRTANELKSITRNCNDQKYNAKLAGEDSTNLYFLHYLRRFGPIKMKAAVKESTKGTELHVMLIDSGHSIRINIKRNEPEVEFKLLDDGVPSIKFIGQRNVPPIRVNIFDVVLVELYASDEKLKGKLVPPE